MFENNIGDVLAKRWIIVAKISFILPPILEGVNPKFYQDKTSLKR